MPDEHVSDQCGVLFTLLDILVGLVFLIHFPEFLTHYVQLGCRSMNSSQLTSSRSSTPTICKLFLVFSLLREAVNNLFPEIISKYAKLSQ